MAQVLQKLPLLLSVNKQPPTPQKQMQDSALEANVIKVLFVVEPLAQRLIYVSNTCNVNDRLVVLVFKMS